MNHRQVEAFQAVMETGSVTKGREGTIYFTTGSQQINFGFGE